MYLNILVGGAHRECINILHKHLQTLDSSSLRSRADAQYT